MKRSYIIGLSILLVLLALGLLWAFNVASRSVETPLVITPNTIIPTNITKNVPIESSESLADTLLQAENSLSGTPGVVASINLVVASSAGNFAISSKTFMGDIAPAAPLTLIQSLAPSFMVGFYDSSAGGWQPFIILKTLSYDDALAGMSAWEPSIASDLASLISSSLGSAENAQGATFQNVVIDNENVRELDSANGAPILVYSLPDNQTIVIATSEEALREIFARLSPQGFGIIK